MSTFRRRRRRPSARFLALTVAGALVLAGCGGQVGAAAVVGSDAISTDTIDGQRSALPAAADADRLLAADRSAQVATVARDRTLVTYAIWHEQLRQAGVASPVTQEEIAALLADPATVEQVDQLLLTTSDTIVERITDTYALRQLVTDAVTAGTPVSSPTVGYEFLSVDSLTTALDDRNRYAGDPDAWTADVAAAGTQRGGSGTATAGGAGVVFIPTGLYSAPEGSFVVVPGTDGSATVLRVTTRSVASAPLAAAEIQRLAPPAISALGAMLLAQGAGAAAARDTQVNPRFGVWDATVAQVVPAPAQL